MVDKGGTIVMVDSVAEESGGRARPVTGRWAKVRTEFNFPEFLALAHKVIDVGDDASMKALATLKEKWEAKLGPLPTSSVDDHPLARGLRRARRNILGRLSTLDKPWLQRFGTSCVLCPDALLESHDHLFFACSFANDCLRVIGREVSIRWPYTSWPLVIQWASVRWRGKHVANASFRALLASLVYHLWLERNRCIFQNTTRSPNEIDYCF
ncbi:UNVERIFIED_CONTAM: hypothetical protein Slati_0875000 [Sesamum latifolium]|uniref:Reverse transcriptase zinc-binding domain-containing protein n=1 Tax=Sesamum latifolium TaxID=2727402 RepID=A0AAW2XN96_9LAMI